MCNLQLSTVTLMGKHSEWRKLAKKERRKRIRRQLAQKRDDALLKEQERRENSSTYIVWLKEQDAIEKLQEEEERRLRDIEEIKWLEKEKEAQIRWRELQEKLRLAKEERIRQNEKIREEWEFEQKRLKELQALKEKQEEDKRRHQEQLIEEINNFVENGGEIPESLRRNFETNPNKETCQFFKKTGACRFNDTCSRNHIRPSISNVLLIPNFYSHYSLEQYDNEYGNDSMLEFETYEIYGHFKEFFYDVVSEMEKYGTIKQFKVCCNIEPHLRGNVYVEYSNCQEAIRSFKLFHGRWYGGKQLNVEFCTIESWKNAVCGQFYRRTCPKGNACNFLHVFRNPNNVYSYIEKDSRSTRRISEDYERDSNYSYRNWRWSESPERPIHLENGLSNGSSSERRHSNNKKSKHRNRSSDRSRSKHHKSSRSTSNKSSHGSSETSKYKTHERKKSHSGSPESSASRSPDTNSRRKHQTSRKKSRRRSKSKSSGKIKMRM